MTRDKAIEDLTALGLGEELKKPVRELSGGQRRRVAVVRAILAGADILFLDEAFTGLDTEIKKTVAGYILKNTRGKTVIAVTHDPEEAALLGGDIMNM